jgi:RNA polymerase sigma factor (sigma-70 family)
MAVVVRLQLQHGRGGMSARLLHVQHIAARRDAVAGAIGEAVLTQNRATVLPGPAMLQHLGMARRGSWASELSRSMSPDRDESGPIIELPRWRLEAARREQDQLLQQLAHQHADTLLVLASRLVGRDDARDVAQEAFISLARWILRKPLPEARALLGSGDELRKLMFRITTCRAYDLLRKQGHESARIRDAVDPECAVHECAPHPHTALELARLTQAYAALPAAQRIAHVLHYYYGFTGADFEATLGITETNSRTLVHRATRALKRAMEEA